MVNKMKMGTAKPETIARVLYQVRAEIVREDDDGLEHADALLRARGLDPEAFDVPAKRERKSFMGRGTRQRAVIDALREGPATLREVCDRVKAKNPDADVGAFYHSIAVCLGSLKKRGAVRHEGVLWRLAQKEKRVVLR